MFPSSILPSFLSPSSSSSSSSSSSILAAASSSPHQFDLSSLLIQAASNLVPFPPPPPPVPLVTANSSSFLQSALFSLQLQLLLDEQRHHQVQQQQHQQQQQQQHLSSTLTAAVHSLFGSILLKDKLLLAEEEATKADEEEEEEEANPTKTVLEIVEHSTAATTPLAAAVAGNDLQQMNSVCSERSNQCPIIMAEEPKAKDQIAEGNGRKRKKMAMAKEVEVPNANGNVGKPKGLGKSARKKRRRHEVETDSPVSGMFIKEFCDEEELRKVEELLQLDDSAAFVNATEEARRAIASIPNVIGDSRCALCKIRFEDIFRLAMHKCPRIRHEEYRCWECEKVFSCPANLASHRRWHRPRLADEATRQKKKTKFGRRQKGREWSAEDVPKGNATDNMSPLDCEGKMERTGFREKLAGLSEVATALITLGMAN